jgi:signal transduction histidine kinase
MNKLSFRYRIIIGFSIILSLVLAIAAYTAINISQFKDHTELLYNHPLRVSNAVRDINSNIHIIHKTMKDITMIKDTSLLDTKLRVVDYYDRQTQESFNLIYKQYLGSKEDIDQAFNSFIDWKPIRAEVIRKMNEGEYEAASNITMGKGNSHVNIIIDQMQNLSDFAEKKADELYHKAIVKEQKALSNLYYLIILIIIISIVLIALLSNTISKPIQVFTEEMKILFKDSEHVETLEGNESESIMLEVTKKNILTLINTLHNQSKELVNFNKSLEERVKERTIELEESQNELKERNSEYESIVEELRQSNDELAIAIDKANESDNLKSAFLANMSHEIRTPLNAILGFTSILQKNKDFNERQQQQINIISKSGNQLLAIVNDVLDISLIETGQLKLHEKETDIITFIEDLIVPYKNNDKFDQLTFIVEHNNFPRIKLLIDQAKLRQIVVNLINNAARHAKEGDITISLEMNDKTLNISVKDQGPGIASEYHKKIFSRFFQIEGSIETDHRGTGLGLSICKGFIQTMGGDIWVESTPGNGAKFFIALPLRIAPPTNTIGQIPNEAKPTPALLKETINILVAEDEILNALYIEEIFSDSNIQITKASNGQEVIDIFKESPDAFDLILMDIKMPILNGFKACQEIKKIKPSIPIVAQTAFAMEDEVIEIKSKFDDYISKPIDSNKLTSLVYKILTA